LGGERSSFGVDALNFKWIGVIGLYEKAAFWKFLAKRSTIHPNNTPTFLSKKMHGGTPNPTCCAGYENCVNS
jgi:hypothetical protein